MGFVMRGLSIKNLRNPSSHQPPQERSVFLTPALQRERDLVTGPVVVWVVVVVVVVGGEVWMSA